jgi:hypothetical protein
MSKKLIKVGIGRCQYCGRPYKTQYEHDSVLGRRVGFACLSCLVERMAVEHDNDPRIRSTVREDEFSEGYYAGRREAHEKRLLRRFI